ncbi:MAG: ParA family partition ATPase [Gemmobacter sp.]
MRGIITLAQQKGGSGKTTLAVHLGVAFARAGARVAFVDTDPQGSLGRWFMTRVETLGAPGAEFSTASAWGVTYEAEKLRKSHDIVIVDTPPKADADLRSALRVADLVLVPVASSHVDLWATESVLDLCARERRPALIVLNRAKAGTRLGEDVAGAAAGLGVDLLAARFGNRIAYAEAMGRGLTAPELGRGPAVDEVAALLAEVRRHLPGG